jgi:ABC-type multidrug transport system ATPase subunit/pSer/pThr/pTyr-binding forkhead associated (FHA) protein
MSVNQCKNCGTNNSATARFCAKCGKPLVAQPVPQPPSAQPPPIYTPPARPAPMPPVSPPEMGACPRCGVPLRLGLRFCPSCGYNMSQPLAASPAQAPQAAGRGAPGTQLLGATDGVIQLAVRWMGGSQQKYQLTKPTTSVGRAPDSDIVINHPAVSGHHLSLSHTPTGMTVTDLGSTNGTQLNGQKIPTNQPVEMRVGAVLRIGDLTGNWVGIVWEDESGEAIRTLSLGKLDLSSVTSMRIGRDPSSYLPLNHPTVSSHHAEIFKTASGLAIRDLGSTNGTFVNGKRIAQGPLQSGDVVQIGPFKLVYDAQQQSLAQSMGLGHRMDAVKVGRAVAKGKLILNNVSLTIQPGEFVSLVGGSGAGKSTLLKALNGYEPANQGQVLLDGESFYPKLDLYRTQMGYVPQDDIIHRELPVKLALWYAAKLRLPDARPEEIGNRIQEALRAVDMIEHSDKRVRVLSGGQRKRVSIAVELLAHPSLFFLDEPTSGLDPGLEKKMMYDLNRLADEGRTVVLVTHATANIEQCDHVAFLSFGKLAYYGPPNEALKFFNVRDFSDIYLKLSQEIDPQKGKEIPQELQPYYQPQSGKTVAGNLWAEHYRRSPQYKQYVVDRQSNLRDFQQAAASQAGAPGRMPTRSAKGSFLHQGVILARRQFDLIRLDMRTLLIMLLMIPLISALFAGVSVRNSFTGMAGTKEQIDTTLLLSLEGKPKDAEAKNIPTADAQTLVMMLGLALTQGGTFAAAYEIVKERAIFKRERAVNLSVVAYVLSKVSILAGFAAFQVVSGLFILSLAVDLNLPGAVFTDSGFTELLVTLYLGILASITFGLFISAFVPTTDVVLYAILVQLFVQIILSGMMFPLNPPNSKSDNPISYVVPAYWTMNAMGSTVDMVKLNANSRLCKVMEMDVQSMTGSGTEKQKLASCDSASADLYLNFEHTPEHMQKMWLGLIVHIFLWTILTIIVQMRKKIE